MKCSRKCSRTREQGLRIWNLEAEQRRSCFVYARAAFGNAAPAKKVGAFALDSGAVLVSTLRSFPTITFGKLLLQVDQQNCDVGWVHTGQSRCLSHRRRTDPG